MKNNPKNFRVQPDKKVRLKDWPTRVKPFYESKLDYEKTLREYVKKLGDFQEKLYAHNQYSLLLIFQAMDAAGKDSVIKHVMSGVNPQGCQVYSFKHPSSEELDHDFLWRTTRCLPERGRIGIFNRSYYEEVLIVRVHPEILKGQGIPDQFVNRDDFWPKRYRSITDLEKHLHRNGTKVIKFFLHVSKEEQRRRFLRRIDEPEKNWKFNKGDVLERRYWKQYMSAYEECLGQTSTEASPWYVVPADDKENTRLIVSEILVEALKDMKLSYPKVSTAHIKELRQMRKILSQKKA